MRISDWSSDVCSSDLIDHQVDVPVVAILVLRAAIDGTARAVGVDVRDDVPDDLVEAAIEAGEHPVVEGPRSIFTAAMLADVGLGGKKPAEVGEIADVDSAGMTRSQLLNRAFIFDWRDTVVQACSRQHSSYDDTSEHQTLMRH